jgi:hypothetical protein
MATVMTGSVPSLPTSPPTSGSQWKPSPGPRCVSVPAATTSGTPARVTVTSALKPRAGHVTGPRGRSRSSACLLADEANTGGAIAATLRGAAGIAGGGQATELVRVTHIAAAIEVRGALIGEGAAGGRCRTHPPAALPVAAAVGQIGLPRAVLRCPASAGAIRAGLVLATDVAARAAVVEVRSGVNAAPTALAFAAFAAFLAPGLRRSGPPPQAHGGNHALHHPAPVPRPSQGTDPSIEPSAIHSAAHRRSSMSLHRSRHIPTRRG